MKRLLKVAVVLGVLLLLSGCKVEIDHFFEEDGSSIFQFALGAEIDPDEGESIDCETEAGGEFSASYANLSQRGSETWCTTGIPVDSPVELAYLYASFNEEAEFLRVNCLSVEDGHLIYDIEVLLDSSGVEEGDSLVWRVTAPGAITSTNADSQSGDTVTWNLTRRDGWVSLEVNADDGNCPAAGFALDLVAETPTTGTAFISVAKPTTSSADADALVAALSRAGWQVTDQGSEIDASQTWADEAGLQTIADGLAPITGSDLTVADLSETDGDGNSEFEARLDLSFYEAFWQGINPAIDDPPFRFSWTPPPGDAESTGDWTVPDARTFSWAVSDAGRIFNMATRVTPTEAEDEGEIIVGDESEGDGSDDGGDDPDDAGDGTSDAPGDADDTAAEQAATDVLVDQVAGDDADDATRAATAAAIAALLGAAGLTAVSMAEAGLSLADVADAVRHGDLDRLSSSPPEDEPVPDGGIRIWDQAAGRAQVFDSWADADRFTAELRAREQGGFLRDTADAMDRSRAQGAAADAAELADIRADRAAIDYWTQLVQAREEALERLEAAEAQQAAIADEGWQEVIDDAFDGIVREVDALPGEIRDAAWATRQALDAVAAAIADPDNYDLQVLAETGLETIYDVLGMMSGGAYGDGFESALAPVKTVARVGGALGQMAWNDKGAFFEMITPIGDLKDSMDPDKTLGQRLGHMGFALADIFGTVAGFGLADEAMELGRLAGATDDARHAVDALDAARKTERATDAVQAARNVERTTDLLDTSRDMDRASDAVQAARDAEKATEAAEASLLASRADELVESQRVAETLNPSKYNEATVAARREAWDQVQKEGAEAVADFKKLPADDLARREAALRVQGNKQALMEMKDNGRVSEELQVAFNNEMRGIYNETDDKVIDWLLDPKTRPDGVPELTPPLNEVLDPNGRITHVIDADGNSIRLFEPTNANPDIVSVGADRDFTVYVTGADGVERAVPSGQVESVYNQAFYEASGGDDMARSLGIEPDADAFATRMDQAITDDVHPESYKNVETVIGAPGKEIGDVQQVGQASAYKHDHWQARAAESSEKAAAAAEAGDDAAAAAWAARAEDEHFEATRQLVKQNGNQVVNRHAALAAQVEEAKQLGTLAPDFELNALPDDLQRAMAFMNDSKTVGMAPVDVEMQMLAELGMTPTDAAQRMGGYLESMEKLRPQAIIDLQRGLP